MLPSHRRRSSHLARNGARIFFSLSNIFNLKKEENLRFSIIKKNHFLYLDFEYFFNSRSEKIKTSILNTDNKN